MRRHVQGMTLIELMIAMILGLLVVGAAIGIFISNSQVYRAAENLGRVQEGARVAFELMARDIREAAGNPCVNNVPWVNVVSGGAGNWWSDMNPSTALQGFDGSTAFPGETFTTGAAQRLAGTEALQMLSGDDNVSTISNHDAGTAVFTVNTTAHGLGPGDLGIACNAQQGAVFQVSSVSGLDIGHGLGGLPGNTSINLHLDSSNPDSYEYAAPNSVLAGLHATRWYVANNARGVPSLYQARLGGTTVTREEVVEGVSAMTLAYLVRGGTNYVAAGTVVDWAEVISVRATLVLQSPDNVGANGDPITRQVVQVASLRNRNP
ncbi:PilW family protein [Luteimonas changyuni]|uniref:PilW family protein n=1 Tax=Luteimonas sp. MJ145 TaxID=3129234 RepID=UPI0031BACA7F